MEVKKLVLAAASALVVIIGIGESFDFHEKEMETEQSQWELYERWRSHHGIPRGLEEKCRRFNVFKENALHVQQTNAMEKTYKLKLNKFADMTNHEFRTAYAGSKVKHFMMFRGRERVNGSFMYATVEEVPDSVDWREKGAITEIKDQGQCGSCWAFSSIAAVEGIHQIKMKKLISLSEQELVDCDNAQNEGCNGGLMEYAFEFIKQRGGITTEDNYPYHAQSGSCDDIKANAVVVSIDGHENVPRNSEEALLKAAANQPISVGIDAGGSDFQLYSEGVYSGQCGTELNHGVAIVGYGTSPEGMKYWIVKNSWGQQWGEDGYIRMQRGVEDKAGQCGIAMEASYPTKNTITDATTQPTSLPKEEL